MRSLVLKSAMTSSLIFKGQSILTSCSLEPTNQVVTVDKLQTCWTCTGKGTVLSVAERDGGVWG
ncbi:hypothetical protein D8674_013776 [Pyrus ussuriensis x Pyrus communis]|uniref:Uncharacterized protein n=1 Tax=Pyrus ussuriensis x Pyrus communis TaxID=2448454 RepID=A0A5N5GRX1_9ROSA|nr:hypothetical protein D8674_013776 [Pyrus ussuriensis x Pyrus communis]